jgi:hypothetical protein
MAAKITFPNRPCPRCGKPIHIKSKSHPACGWKASPVAASTSHSSANGKPKSNYAAVSLILADSGNDLKPLDIQEQLKKRFNIKMETSVISNYKSTILRKGAKAKRVGRPKMHRAVASRASASSTISIEDIKAVKDLAERIGVDKLRQLAEVLAK